MKRREFEKRVKDENLKMESYHIELDSYDTEDAALSDFYQYVLSQIKAETQFGHRKKK